MPANPCRDFFALNATNRDFVKGLQKTPNPVAWETLSASDHSPGPVQPGELLYRQVMHPIHVDVETRSLKPTAFDDAANKGLSVERLSHVALADIQQAGRDRAAAQRKLGVSHADRKLHAVAELSADEIRAILDENQQRGFAIFDTANCENRAHADICQVVSTRKSGRSVRSQLIEAVRSLIEE